MFGSPLTFSLEATLLIVIVCLGIMALCMRQLNKNLDKEKGEVNG